jgi:hypothetical protein
METPTTKVDPDSMGRQQILTLTAEAMGYTDILWIEALGIVGAVTNSEFGTTARKLWDPLDENKDSFQLMIGCKVSVVQNEAIEPQGSNPDDGYVMGVSAWMQYVHPPTIRPDGSRVTEIETLECQVEYYTLDEAGRGAATRQAIASVVAEHQRRKNECASTE